MTCCKKDSLTIYKPSALTQRIAQKFNCRLLEAALLQMRGITDESSACDAAKWFSPNLSALLKTLDIGCADDFAAAELIRQLKPGAHVIVYGDYDVDGISSTSIAMELVISRGAHVRYFIPHRFNQGYGFHNEIAVAIAQRRCDLVIVVDCGTQDLEAFETLTGSGIPVIIFDHHLVEGTPVDSSSVANPQIAGNDIARKLCATGVIWCWIWQNRLLPEYRLMKLLDVVALATIADCVSLSSPLNRALVRAGLNVLRAGTRPGLKLLMEELGLVPANIETDDLAMKVIPCLNAAGRLYLADLAVNILFPSRDLLTDVRRLIELNTKRKDLSSKILEQVAQNDYGKFKYVLTDENWSVGVLSSVASRVCYNRNAPVAMVASVKGIMRGTLRMPSGGNAVEILKELSPLLYTWGGHRLAAGFSVKTENWEKLRCALEEMLGSVQVEEEREELIYCEPSKIDMALWNDLSKLGPFGMDNPMPEFYFEDNGSVRLEPLGRDGKHFKVHTASGALVAFGASELFNENPPEKVRGWSYKPRVDRWRKTVTLQYILEKMVV